MKEEVGKAKSSSSSSSRLKEYKYTPSKCVEIKKTVFKASYVFKVKLPPSPTTKDTFPRQRVVYQPTTDETRAAYDEFLSLIKNQKPLVTSPISVLRFAVEKIVEILKNDAVDNLHKKKKIDLLLDIVTNNVFDRLLQLSKLLTDFYSAPPVFSFSAHDHCHCPPLEQIQLQQVRGKDPIPLEQGGGDTTIV